MVQSPTGGVKFGPQKAREALRERLSPVYSILESQRRHSAAIFAEETYAAVFRRRRRDNAAATAPEPRRTMLAGSGVATAARFGLPSR